jgi:hypothetical protein
MKSFSRTMMVYVGVIAVLAVFLLLVSQQKIAVITLSAHDSSRNEGVRSDQQMPSFQQYQKPAAFDDGAGAGAYGNSAPPEMKKEEEQQQQQKVDPIHDVTMSDLRLIHLKKYMKSMKPVIDEFIINIGNDAATERKITLDFCEIGLYCIPGQERVGTVSWDGVVIRYIPSKSSHKPYFALMSTGVNGNIDYSKVRRGMRERLVMKMLYAEVHGYEVAQYMLRLTDMVEHAVKNKWIARNEVGPYINDEELFAGHKWYNAWTKPYALLGEMLSSRFHWFLFLDLDAQVDYTMISTPLTKFIPEDRDAAEDVRNQNMKRKRGYASGITHIRTPFTPDWYYKESDYHVVAPAYGMPKNPKFEMAFSTFTFMVRSSHESELLMRAWLGHSDCNCWVEQSAFWLEMLRMAMRFNQPLTQKFEEEYEQCMEMIYGETGKAAMRLDDLTVQCREPGEV